MAKIDFEPIQFEPETPTKGAEKIAFEPIAFEPEGEAEVVAPPAEKEVPLSRKLSAALQGYGQMAGMGYMPQLQALAGWVPEQVMSYAQGVEPKSYTELRDQFSEHDKNLQMDAPAAYTTGTATGIGASMLIPGGAAAKGASLLSKIGKGAAVGGAMAAAQNPGDTKGEISPLQLSDRLKNSRWGFALGGAAPAVVGGTGKLLEKGANSLAFRSLGSFARDARINHDYGRVGDIGRSLLDNKVIGWIPRGFGTLAKRAKAVGTEAGQDIEKYIDEVEAAVQRGEISGIDRAKILKELETMLVDDDIAKGVAGAAESNDKIRKLIENSDGPDLTVKQSWAKKQLADDRSGWKKPKDVDLTDEESFNRTLAKSHKAGIEDAAQRFEKKTGKKVGTYDEKARKYSHLTTAERILRMREGHELARRMTAPLIGSGLNVASVLTGDGKKDFDSLAEAALKGAVVGKGLQYANRFGPQVGAKGMDALSKIAKTNPWVIGSLIKENQGETNGKK